MSLKSTRPIGAWDLVATEGNTVHMADAHGVEHKIMTFPGYGHMFDESWSHLAGQRWIYISSHRVHG